MDLAWWANHTGLWAAVFTALAALLGVASWVLSGWVSDAKDAALAKFQDESKVAVAEAVKGTAEAIEGAAVAQAAAASANERTKAHEVELLRQQERAALAEKGLLELKQKVEWRSIGRTNGEPLIAALRVANPKGPVRIKCVLGDPEGNEFATQLGGLLGAGGWTVVDTEQSVYVGGNPKGWGLAIRSNNAPPAHVATLRSAFAIAGFPLAIIEQPDVRDGEVVMLVGIKQ
ncbi:MAG: hypothetical protein Q7R30_19085 [Acidobacteriota bacterium]|nr:hypothetical protein [Acidobacteriota bacterium]